MAKQKRKLYFTSLDVILYATFVFALGIGVGLAFGRYKSSRFYFAEERLKVIETYNQYFKSNNSKIETALNETIKPLIVKLKERLIESNKTDVAPKDFNYTKTFGNLPKLIYGMSGISLDLKDGNNVKWAESIDLTSNSTGVHVDKIVPDNDVGIYWIGVPEINTK
jgi:hypothetical protein